MSWKLPVPRRTPARLARGPGLGRRLMGWFLLLSLVPLLTSNTIGYIRSQGITEGLLEQSLDVTSLLQVLHVQNRAERAMLFLGAVAAGNEFLGAGVRRAQGIRGEIEEIATRDAVESYLARQRAEENQIFGDLYLLDMDGQLLASAMGRYGERGSFPCAGHAAGIAVVHGTDPGAPPTVCIAVPLSGLDGEHGGFLGGLIPPAGLTTFLRFPSPPGAPIRTILLDESGRPVYFSQRYGEEGYASVFETTLEETEGRARYVNHDGVEVAGRRTQIPGLPWTQVTEVPVEAALGPLRGLRRTSIYFGAGLTLLVIMVAWFVSGGIVAPVDRLVAATRRLGSGDLSARVERTGSDEIGELARAFNDMAEDLATTSARVTELHQKEIERAQHLATVGELASGLAHEIKNPVVGISHGIDLVRRRIGANPSVDPILEEVTRELHRIETAIRDLLTFARPASPTLVSTDINRVIERACRLVQASAESRGVSLQTSFLPGIPTVPADATLLEQALVNIVLNGIEATPAGGTVRVAPEATETGVVIRVSDTGVGIPPDQRELVFKPFYTTRPKGGTGLGLSITREIVERQGGQVSLTSLEGFGTTIEITLPINGAAASQPASHSGAVER